MNRQHRKKILWIAGWYPTRHKPALGNFIHRHAQAASACDDICVVHAASSDRDETIVTQEGNLVSIVEYFKKSRWLPVQYYRWKKAWNKAISKAEEITGEKFDALHLHIIIPAGRIAAAYASKKSLPFIITEHSTRYQKKRSVWESRLIRNICNNARFICPVTNQLGNALKHAGVNSEMKVIPNVVNTGLFRPVEKKPHEKKKILHVSTLNEKQKNISGMLRVIKRLSEMRHDFELEIISEYSFTEAKQYAERLGIKNEQIRFSGLQPLEEVARAMQQASVFVLFSNEENLPCVLLESVACGTPVISTRVGGIQEWITGECGVLIEKGDETSLLNALNHVLNHPEKYHPEIMHAYIHEHFSYASISNQFHSLYSQV